MLGSIDYLYMNDDDSLVRYRLVFEKKGKVIMSRVMASGSLEFAADGVFVPGSMRYEVFINVVSMILLSRVISGVFDFSKIRLIDDKVKR